MVADSPLERQGFRTDGPRGRGALSFRPLLADVSPYARIKELPRERDRGFESRLLQRGVRCELDAAQDRMTVLGAAKVPFFNRDTLAAMLRQRRSERTCGTCDRSTPARLLLGQRTPDRLSPTARKCENWTGDCTAITRQFAQSSPSIEGSIWSRRGNLPPYANSFHSRSFRHLHHQSVNMQDGFSIGNYQRGSGCNNLPELEAARARSRLSRVTACSSNAARSAAPTNAWVGRTGCRTPGDPF